MESHSGGTPNDIDNLIAELNQAREDERSAKRRRRELGKQLREMMKQGELTPAQRRAARQAVREPKGGNGANGGGADGED